MEEQKQADHRFLRERVDKLTQQGFVVRCFWSSLCCDPAEDSVALIGPLMEFLWGDRLLLRGRYLYFRRPGRNVPLFTSHRSSASWWLRDTSLTVLCSVESRQLHRSQPLVYHSQSLRKKRRATDAVDWAGEPYPGYLPQTAGLCHLLVGEGEQKGGNQSQIPCWVCCCIRRRV
jgi:hypothetical protein